MVQFIEEEGMYKIMHQYFVTDRYEYGETIVKATSKQDAMDKLNEHLLSKPNGIYTPLPCKSIKDVYNLKVLQ